MDETISHANYIPPRDFGMLILRFIGNSGSGLTNYFNRFDQGKSQHPIKLEILPGFVMSKINRVFRGIEHVSKPDLVIRPHTAPLPWPRPLPGSVCLNLPAGKRGQEPFLCQAQ
jgi:hypothetical protein